MKLFLIVALLLAISSSASAGLFSPDNLSDKDAASIHKIAVISALGDTLHLDYIGLTAFQNKIAEIPVPEWDTDGHVLAHALDSLKADHRFSFEELNLARGAQLVDLTGTRTALRPAGRRQLVEQGRMQGVDAVLLIEVSGNPNDPTISPGFGLYDRRALGMEHVPISTSIALVLFRVDGIKVLALHAPAPLTQAFIAWPIKTLQLNGCTFATVVSSCYQAVAHAYIRQNRKADHASCADVAGLAGDLGCPGIRPLVWRRTGRRICHRANSDRHFRRAAQRKSYPRIPKEARVAAIPGARPRKEHGVLYRGAHRTAALP